MSFGTMPHGWISAGRLTEFSPRQGVTGRHIAALKCYLAIAAYRDYYDGYSVLSTYDLSKIGGCSRPMVLEGVAMLQSMGLVELELKAANNTNRYRLPMDDAASFRKVPQDTLVTHLPQIGNRHERFLDALKLYMAMLYVRNEATCKATISHKSLVEYTGVRPEAVAAGNGVLAAHNFFRIRYSDEWSKTGHPTNEYELLGDFRGQRAFRARPIEQNKRSRLQSSPRKRARRQEDTTHTALVVAAAMVKGTAGPLENVVAHNSDLWLMGHVQSEVSDD